LFSTGTAENVINITLALQGMKRKPMPSQLGCFHQWEANIKAGMSQNPAAHSRSCGRDRPLRWPSADNLHTSLPIYFLGLNNHSLIINALV
ncbi:hypothetical protein PISMIDRAFT_115173, partial [Pisolithus microcarpus 441]